MSDPISQPHEDYLAAVNLTQHIAILRVLSQNLLADGVRLGGGPHAQECARQAALLTSVACRLSRLQRQLNRRRPA